MVWYHRAFKEINSSRKKEIQLEIVGKTKKGEKSIALIDFSVSDSISCGGAQEILPLAYDTRNVNECYFHYNNLIGDLNNAI